MHTRGRLASKPFFRAATQCRLLPQHQSSFRLPPRSCLHPNPKPVILAMNTGVGKNEEPSASKLVPSAQPEAITTHQIRAMNTGVGKKEVPSAFKRIPSVPPEATQETLAMKTGEGKNEEPSAPKRIPSVPPKAIPEFPEIIAMITGVQKYEVSSPPKRIPIVPPKATPEILEIDPYDDFIRALSYDDAMLGGLNHEEEELDTRSLLWKHAKLAMGYYNETTGSKFKVVDVLNGSSGLTMGFHHHIKFLGKPEGASHSEMVPFYAEIYEIGGDITVKCNSWHPPALNVDRIDSCGRIYCAVCHKCAFQDFRVAVRAAFLQRLMPSA